MRECDVLVNSSRSEGESNAILEAMATGTLPVLAPQELVDCIPNPNSCGGSGGCAGICSGG